MSADVESVAAAPRPAQGQPAPCRASRSLREILILLVAAVALPLITLNVAAVSSGQARARARAEAELLERVRGLAHRLDAEFRVAQATLDGLGASAALAGGDLETFEGEMRTVSARNGGAPVTLVNRAGRVVLTTAWAPGERRVGVPAPEDARRVVASGKAEVSNLFAGTVTGRAAIGVGVPVPSPAGPPGHGLGLSFSRERLAAMLLQANPSAAEGEVGILADRTGRIVARTVNDAETAGLPGRPEVVARLHAAPEGLIRGLPTREGTPAVIAFARAPLSGYHAVLTMPEASFEAPLRAELRRALLGSALAVAVGLGLALALARTVIRAFGRVAAAGGDAAPTPASTGLREADRLLGALARAAAERRQATEGRMLLLREVDHRARNALAVALSLVRLTPRRDAAEFASAVEGRIAAMSRAHSLLAAESWRGVDLAALVGTELAPYADRVRAGGPPVRLAADAAQPVGMLLHELATNAAKHGALSAPRGRVELEWGLDDGDGALRLTWRERGGPAVARPARAGFGTRLLDTLAGRQLGATLARDWREEGLTATLNLPARHAAPA
ncbi:HWE histidine kinase domain-containing protein [Craurococcus roseus]|uniref:histidine kinase n=1 Tax=Craurococcus roseus TaxID=77585 RepID=A0ABN1F2R3_9PROT